MVTDLCARDHLERGSALDAPAPARAEVGVLCRPCFARLQWRLSEVPALLAHIRSLVAGGGSSGGEPVSGTKDPRRLPLNDTALDDADELFASLGNEAWYSAAEGGWEATGLERFQASRKPIDGLRTAVTPGEAHEGARVLVGLLEWQLPTLVLSVDVLGLYDAVVPLVQKLKARYPLEEPPAQRQRGRVCPACGEKRVYVTWESLDAEGMPLVRCEACWHVMPVLWEQADGGSDES